MIVFLSVKMQLREASVTPGISTNLTQRGIFPSLQRGFLWQNQEGMYIFEKT